MKYTSPNFSAASGSVAGCTYSRNRFGSYIRRRAVPINPGSAQQQIMTAALSALVAAWKNLSTANQAGWTNYALNTPKTDPLGQTITLTGQQMYIACNSLRIQFGVSTIPTPPSLFGVALLTPPGVTSLTAATGVSVITFTNTDTWAGAVGGYLAVYMSRPQAPSTNYFKGPYRFAGKINGAATPPTSPQNINSPFTYVAGQRAFYQFRAANSDARISAVERATTLAV